MAGAGISRFVRQQIAALRSDETTGTKSAVGLSAAALAGNVMGLVFTVVLARALGPDGYGSLASLVSAFLIISIVGSALQITVAREVSFELAHHDPTMRQHVLRWTAVTLAITAACVVGGILFREELAVLTGVEGDEWAAAAIPATGGVWLLLSVIRGALQGLQKFQAVGLSIVGEATLRLVVAVILVSVGMGVTGGFLGSALSILITALVLLVPLLRALASRAESFGDDIVADPDHVATDYRFLSLVRRTWPALAALTLIAMLQNSDVIMVKREAEEAIAGAYAADAVAAKVIVWVAIGLGFYVVPEAARRGAGESARRLLSRAIGLIGVAGAGMVALYFVAGQQVIEIAFGPEYSVESDALPLLGMAMVCLSVTYLAAQLFLALKQFWFLVLLAVAVAAQLLLVSRVAESPYDTAVVMLAVQLSTATAMVAASGILKRVKG